MFNQFYLLSYIIGVILAYQGASLSNLTQVIWLMSLPLTLGAPRPVQRLFLAMGLGTLAVFLAASYHQSKRLAPELWQVPQEIQLKVRSHRLLESKLHQYQVESGSLNQSLVLAHYVPQQALKIGACYTLGVKLKPKHALGNPTTAHQAKQQWVSREFMQGYIHPKLPIVEIACEKEWLSLDPLRTQILQFLKDQKLSETAEAMIQALVLGERGGLRQEHWEVLQKTGTAHLLAISGLHIGLVYLLGFWLFSILLRPLGLIFLRANMIILSSMIALGLSGFYVLLSGAGISSLRAWGMLCLVTLLILWRERLQGLQILLIVVAVLLILDPLSGMGLGLWLSAGAVFALIWLGASSWQVHWKLALIMLPITALWLKATWLSPLANLIAIPWVSFLIVPGALTAVLFSSLQIPGAEFLLQAVAWQIDKLWWGLSWVSQYALLLHWSLLSATDWLLFMGLCALLLLPWRLFGPFPFVILFASLTWNKPPLPEPGTLLLHVIDAGQGTALLVQVRDKNLLFDVGSAMVTDYLRHYRVKKLDIGIVSHHDKDHRAGLADLLKHIPITTLYAGESLVETQDYQPCMAGESWNWEEVTFQFISPSRRGLQGNNASCVLKISLGEQSILFTGDIEKKIETELVTNLDPALLQSTILIAPHHGSKTSSTLKFIKAVSPTMVIYPTGYLNAYHHPHPDIVARYAEEGVKQYNTAQDGALRVKLSKSGIEAFHCYTKDHPQWWAMNEEARCSGYLAQAGH